MDSGTILKNPFLLPHYLHLYINLFQGVRSAKLNRKKQAPAQRLDTIAQSQGIIL
jgi:hypothetical protein